MITANQPFGTGSELDLDFVLPGCKSLQVYTREYCSPEVAQAVVSSAGSMVVNPASDLWGIGIIMYELATGRNSLCCELLDAS